MGTAPEIPEGYEVPAGYAALDREHVAAWLADCEQLRAQLGGTPAAWHIREVGDGNLNLVFLVDGPQGALCVKQALPYVRAAGASWPMALSRAFYEWSYYEAMAPHVGELIPRIHRFDAQRCCLVMERLAPHIILRRGLIEARRFPRAAADVGEFVARAAFFTSGLAAPFEKRMRAVGRFAGNVALVRISVDLIFVDPYCASPRNRHTPQLDALVAQLRGDAALKVAAARFGRKFLTEAQALIHGDLHSGSVMVTESDTRVIDPEFAFYGPIGFDLGAFLGNLLLAWYAQPGHEQTAGERRAYQEWILEQCRVFWETFRACFLALWRGAAHGDVFAAPMFTDGPSQAALEAARQTTVVDLFADMLGFAACKMIRRILGFAHVADFETIAEPSRRAACETGALALARALLAEPERFGSLDAVLEAVPRHARSLPR